MAHLDVSTSSMKRKRHSRATKNDLRSFFVANNVKDNRKVAVFLSVIGPKTYGIHPDTGYSDCETARTF